MTSCSLPSIASQAPSVSPQKNGMECGLRTPMVMKSPSSFFLRRSIRLISPNPNVRPVFGSFETIRPVPMRPASALWSGCTIFRTYSFTSRRLLSITMCSTGKPIIRSMFPNRMSMLSDSVNSIRWSGSADCVITPLSFQTCSLLTANGTPHSPQSLIRAMA